MNLMARQFFQTGTDSHFDQILNLCENNTVKWSSLSETVLDLPRGWFELSRIKSEDRIDFMRDFWIDLLPYQPSSHQGVLDFFSSLEDVSVVVAKSDEEYHAFLVYSLQENQSFFCALPPATDKDLSELRFDVGIPLPRDYLSFLKVHNGLGRRGEFGLLPLEEIVHARKKVVEIASNPQRIIRTRGQIIDPSSLIPFFEIPGLNSFQCFFSDWCPGNEMGNVYLSGIDYIISDTSDRNEWTENLAFPTFLDWLMQYLEGVN